MSMNNYSFKPGSKLGPDEQGYAWHFADGRFDFVNGRFIHFIGLFYSIAHSFYS
jgi:hypothetical protein